MGDANPDTATGKEGDVEARCFRKLRSGLNMRNVCLKHKFRLIAVSRTRFTTRSACCHSVSADGIWTVAWGRNQKPYGKSRFRYQPRMVDWSEMVGGK